MINMILYLYQHTTPPFCLQTACVRPVTSQRFGDIVREKSDVFYIGQLLSYDKKLYNFQRHTSEKNRTILSSDNIVRFLSLFWNQLNTYKYMDYYSFTDPERMECWVGLVDWPIADNLRTKWSPVNHRLGAGQRKSVSQRSTSIPYHWAMPHTITESTHVRYHNSESDCNFEHCFQMYVAHFWNTTNECCGNIKYDEKLWSRF